MTKDEMIEKEMKLFCFDVEDEEVFLMKMTCYFYRSFWSVVYRLDDVIRKSVTASDRRTDRQTEVVFICYVLFHLGLSFVWKLRNWGNLPVRGLSFFCLLHIRM
jgi:hypothetical protein